MDELIIRYLQGGADEGDVRELRQWLSESDANRARYERIASVWSATAEAFPLADLGSTSPPATADFVKPSLARALRWRPTGWSLARAASVAAILGAGLVVGRHLSHAPTDSRLAAEEIITKADETVTVTLTDGSVVRVGPNTRLRARSEGSDRTVWLDGKAFFAVAKVPGSRFHVRTEAGEAVVLGTRFEIDTRSQDLRLVVVEGRVALSAAGHQVEVNADQVSYVKNGQEVSLEHVDRVDQMLTWLGGFLVFQDTPLREAASELETRYGVPVRVAPELRDREVTGWFNYQDFGEVFEIVCRVTNAKCAVQDGVASMNERF